MKLTRLGLVAVALTATIASTYAAGLWSTLPVVGSASFCASILGTGNSQSSQTGQGAGSTISGSTICGQTVPAGPLVLTGLELVPADSGLAGGAQPATVTIPSALLGNFSGFPRNYLDNGSMNVQQRGTGTVTCGTTTVPSTAYGPDRWGCHANVTSGAGRTALVTTAALLPAGFSNVNTVFRTSGALLQPICTTQIVPTLESTALAGKTVSLSFYAAALAGLAADNNNVITASIFTGTGSDQGFGTLTASPAITPAWTGLTSPVAQTPITISVTPTRYSVTGAIPATATEVGVAICFTPTATGAGATDGFAVTGVQLEVAPSPSAYEVHFFSYDLARAQRYFYRLTESATAINQRGMCAVSTTSLAVCQINFPVTMRSAPTMTYTAGFELTGSAQSSATVCTATRTSTTLTGAAASTLGVPIDCTSSAGFGAAGTAAQLYDIGTGSATGVITASADF